MTTTLRIADSVEGLSDAEPNIVIKVRMGINRFNRGEYQKLKASFVDLGDISGSFTTTVDAMTLRRLFPSIHLMAGYRIINKRGRRKLVEAKSSSYLNASQPN